MESLGLIIVVLIILAVAWAMGLLKLGGQAVDAGRDLAANRIEVVSFESDIKKANDMSKLAQNMSDTLVSDYANAKKTAQQLRKGLVDVETSGED